MDIVFLVAGGALIGIGSTYLIGSIIDYYQDKNSKVQLITGLLNDIEDLIKVQEALRSELDQHGFQVYKLNGKIQIRKKKGRDLSKKNNKK